VHESGLDQAVLVADLDLVAGLGHGLRRPGVWGAPPAIATVKAVVSNGMLPG
jgi:hypothetical protein